MSEPERIIDGGGSELGRELFESARGDAPSERGRRRALVALGFAATVSDSASAGAAGQAGSSGGAVAGAGAGVAKWGAGVVALALVAGGAYYATTRGAQPRSPAQTAPLAAPTAPAVDPARRAEPPEALEPARPSTLREREASPALAAELSLIDRGERALRAGDPAAAIRALDRYRARFPRGVLAAEADMLRIRALSRAGHDLAAEREARRFLRQHANSPLAPEAREHAAEP